MIMIEFIFFSGTKSYVARLGLQLPLLRSTTPPALEATLPYPVRQRLHSLERLGPHLPCFSLCNDQVAVVAAFRGDKRRHRGRSRALRAMARRARDVLVAAVVRFAPWRATWMSRRARDSHVARGA